MNGLFNFSSHVSYGSNCQSLGGTVGRVMANESEGCRVLDPPGSFSSPVNADPFRQLKSIHRFTSEPDS